MTITESRLSDVLIGNLKNYCDTARKWWDTVLLGGSTAAIGTVMERSGIAIKAYTHSVRSCIKGVAVFPYVTSARIVTMPVSIGFRQIVDSCVDGYEHNGIVCIVKSNLHGINNANQFVAFVDKAYLEGNGRSAEPVFMCKQDAYKIYKAFSDKDDPDTGLTASLLLRLAEYGKQGVKNE